jgi:redox-sensing transcriptional repressor
VAVKRRRKPAKSPAPRKARASSVLVISLPRLFLYHRALEDAVRDGRQVLTSQELSRRVGRGISSTQVRKDLSHIGNFGRRGQGYDVVVLVRKLARVLGLDRDWRIAIVGFGYLGHALATFLEYREEKFHIAAIFDRDDTIVGTQWHGVRISHVDDLEKVLPVVACSIGIITVPAAAAQEVADKLVACGITALLNFAPATLKLPSSVTVRAIDLASELSILTSHLG